VLAVAAALGTTYLGNTYQSANLVSNLLFELLAAGLLSSVLVPPFVRLVDQRRRADAESLAGALLGVVLLVLGAVVVVGVAGRAWIMRALTVGVGDPVIRAQEVRLGAFLLLLFLPQVLLYAVGAVATALLAAERRFAAAAFAPAANNVCVVATMGLYRWVEGPGAGLQPSLGGRLVLGLGTTAGVAAMTALPLLDLRRADVTLRPRWVPRAAGLPALARAGLWGAVQLAALQVLVAVTLVVANRTPGGVVAYHLAFTAFLLPFALLAHPVFTTLYPALASDAEAGRWPAFAAGLARGARAIAFRVAPASAVLVVLAAPALGVIRLGALDAAGAELAGRVLSAYALGLVGYSLLQLLVRASFAAGDARSPAIVTVALATVGAALMLAGNALASGGDRVVALGLAHSVAMVAGAAALGVVLHRRVGPGWPLGASLARALACAALAGGAAWVVSGVVPVGRPGAGRLEAAGTVVLGSLVAGGVYLAGQFVLRAPELARAGRSHGEGGS